MSIWILAFALCAVFAVIGFFSGAVRAIMMWAGVVVASMLTGSIAPKLTGLMPKIGIKHPLWIQLSPYIIVFSLLTLVIFGIGFAIHHKIALIYKYQRDDYSRVKWERMNRHLGLAIGLVVAVMVLFIVARIAFVGGYLTAQMETDDGGKNPAWVTFLSRVRNDLQATGLDRAVAALDKTSVRFYDAADVIGLIYHNRGKIQPRLVNYPYFLSLGQRSELQELAEDKDYTNLIFGDAPDATFGAIVNHPHTQRLLANQEILNEVKGVDLKDLRAFLKTGKSAKYDEEKILGRWFLDKDAVLTQVRKSQPTIKGNELLAIKRGIEALPDITMINTLDNKTIVKAVGGGAVAEGDPAAAAAAAEAAAAAAAQADPYQRMRGAQRPPPAPRPAVAPGAAPTPPPVLQIAGEGEWKAGETGGYQITVPINAGAPQALMASIEGDELTVSKDGRSLIFIRAE